MVEKSDKITLVGIMQMTFHRKDNRRTFARFRCLAVPKDFTCPTTPTRFLLFHLVNEILTTIATMKKAVTRYGP